MPTFFVKKKKKNTDQICFASQVSESTLKKGVVVYSQEQQLS